jgi:hypothetical protein
MKDIESRLSELENKLINVSTQLTIEQARNEIYREIISNNTSIILTGSGLKVINPPPKLQSPQIKPLKIKSPQLKPSKPRSPVTNNVVVDEMPPLSLAEDVDPLVKIKDIFERFTNSKNIQNKNIIELKKVRKTMFATMSLTEYIDMSKEHVRILTDIFNDKAFPEKKIIITIRSTLTPLDLRLLRYNGYFNSHVDIDEIQRLQNNLDTLTPSSPEYVVLNTNTICENMYNYGSVLFPVRTNLLRVLFNRNGMNNLIYLESEKSTKNDPYSFYYLESVNNNKRFWVMDCRLEDFTNSIINNLVPYMIDNFKKMYRDVFGDNDYRADYKKRCQLTDCDCEQLLKNIFTLSDFKTASKMIRSLVKDNGTHIRDEKDNFNMFSDDALQKKRFSKTNKDYLTDVPKQLFTTISVDEITEFTNNL